MIRIAVCDDDIDIRNSMHSSCCRVLEGLSISHEILDFDSGAKLLEYSGDAIALLFLDIEMPGMDGIEVKNSLENDSNVKNIVFVTSHPEPMQKAFGKKTIGYELKPIDDDVVSRYIERVINEQDEYHYISIPNGKNPFRILESKIICIEGSGNYSYIYKADREKLLFTIKLKDLELSLSASNIVRIHKSYFVNLRHVRSIDKNTLRLDNDVNLTIGRSYMQAFREAYQNFVNKINNEMF